MNTIGEAYVMQLYLQQLQLEEVGVRHFDEWVSLYAQPRMAFEMRPDGSGFRFATRLAMFVNLPELSVLWRQVLNLRTKAQMGLPEPALVTGKVIPVVVPPSAAPRRFVQSLATRADAVRSERVDPTVDNLLRVVSDGRKAALIGHGAAPAALASARWASSRRITFALNVCSGSGIMHTSTYACCGGRDGTARLRFRRRLYCFLSS